MFWYVDIEYDLFHIEEVNSGAASKWLKGGNILRSLQGGSGKI